MKRILVALLALVLTLSLCVPGMAQEEKPLVGILAPAATHGWVAGVTYHAQNAAEELGLNYRVLSANNGDEMASQMDTLVSLGAKAIVIFPQWGGMEFATQMAMEQGVAIFNFDMLIDVEGTYFLSGNNYDMGVQSAQYMAEKLEGQGKVVILDVPTSGNVAADRKAGFLDTIAKIAPNIEIVGIYATQFTREAGLTDMEAILAAQPQIDGVFSMDDETSIGALSAIKEAGRTDVRVITGGGGCQEYFTMMPESDINIASALYSPEMIKQCVENAAKVLAGEEVEKQIILPTTIVDKANVADYLDANSPY